MNRFKKIRLRLLIILAGFLSLDGICHPAPVVDYIMSSFCFGDTTFFTNQTTRAETYTWNIYEQNTADTSYTAIYTSTLTNIKFLFAHKGNFRVELIAENGHTISLVRNLNVSNVPSAGFYYQDCLSHFVNMSTCYGSCLWDFGDGYTSAQKDPVHYYKSTGKYNVSVIIYQGAQSDTLSDSVLVYTVNDLNGDFTYEVNKDSVFFHANDSVSGPFTLYIWSFGDGTTYSGYYSTGRKLYHTYLKKDTTYTVFMLARSLCLTSYMIQNVFVPDSTPVYGTSVYPNPVEDSKLHFTSDRKKDLTKIKVINMLGQEESDYSISETTKGYTLDLVDLSPGVYFMNFYLGSEVKRYRIIKK